MGCEAAVSVQVNYFLSEFSAVLIFSSFQSFGSAFSVMVGVRSTFQQLGLELDMVVKVEFLVTGLLSLH